VSTYSVPDDEIRATGVRFTVAQLNEMADAFMRGRTPPPLSFNENVLLQALIRQRLTREPGHETPLPERRPAA
jgi:hypothetical protein